MTTQEIKELIQAVLESGIAELEVQRGENRVRIRRSAVVNQEIVLPPVSPQQPAVAVNANPVAAAPPAPPVPATTATAPLSTAQAAATDGLVLVKSPIVGTFYDAPSPASPPFVRPGDKIRLGQVLCIIESMKLMNEIESEIAGEVVARLVENAQPVEYGEALFSVRPY